MDKIASKTFSYIKFRETELVEMCEIMAHYAWKNAEMNLKSTTTNNEYMNEILGGMLDLA